jgi:hypothetical protein
LALEFVKVLLWVGRVGDKKSGKRAKNKEHRRGK